MRTLAEIIRQLEPFDSTDLAEMRKALSEIDNFENQAAFRHASIRTGVEGIASAQELIAAIVRFDDASGQMVNRSNWINGFVLAFAILAVILGGVAAWISWLSYQLAVAQAGK